MVLARAKFTAHHHHHQDLDWVFGEGRTDSTRKQYLFNKVWTAKKTVNTKHTKLTQSVQLARLHATSYDCQFYNNTSDIKTNIKIKMIYE